MILGPEVFSLRDVSEQEANFFRSLVGGNRPDVDATAQFVAAGEPLLRTSHDLRTFVHLAQAAIVEHVAEDAGPAFRQGALIYASVFGFLNRTDRLPVADGAVAEINAGEVPDVIIDAASAIHANLRFCDVLDYALSVQGIPGRHEPAAHVGAGVLHLVVQASERAVNRLSAFETDPGLADLRAMFDSLDS